VTGKYNRTLVVSMVQGYDLLIGCTQVTTVSGTLDWRTVDEL